MRIESSSAAPEGWDAYVEQHELASAYHRSAAVAIGQRAFGLRTTYGVARGAQGEIAGVLPLVEQSSVLFGRFLVSLPFVTYGGILAEHPAVAGALAGWAAAVAMERGADHAELRDATPLAPAGFAERRDKVSMMLELPGSEAALAKRLGSKLRSQIRRADREALDLVWGGRECLREFHLVFAVTMHELGTPVYPPRFFEAACEALQGLTRVLVVRMRGAAHAAAILVRHGNVIEVPWAGATPAAKRLAVNMRMYWELLRYAMTTGAEAFDFGRCTVGSGTYRFKAQWGATPRQLHWHYWLPAGAPLPRLNQSNPRYARAASLWRRMPLWCANALGPHIVRHLP